MSIRLEDLLGSFRRHLRAASKAPRTIELYSQSVRYFSRWLADRDRPATLEELTRHAISAWLAELAETCQPSTVATRLRGMRRFCRWLVVEGEVDKAPTEGIEIATAPDKPVPILTDAEIIALLKACAVPRGRAAVFHRTVVLGRRSTPCRSSRSAARASQRRCGPEPRPRTPRRPSRSRSSGSVPF